MNELLYIYKNWYQCKVQLKLFVPELIPLFFKLGNIFQKRRVSSPAPVTIFYPHGLIERYKTRKEWPVNVATFYIVGYFHTIIWFKEYPWVETISLDVFENIKLQTWDPVSIALIGCNVWVFQNLMHLSAVPPPVAKSPA